MGELADLADRRAGQRGIVGCLLQACRLEVVSEGLLQVAPAGDLAGLRDGDFRSLPSRDGVAAALHRERGVEQDAFASHDGGQGCRPGGCFGEGNQGLGKWSGVVVTRASSRYE